MLNVPELKLPEWKHYRIIHSKYPTVNLFTSDNDHNYSCGFVESLTSGRTLLTAYEDSSMTSATTPLITEQDAYVDKGDLRYGDGWGAVMASFAYPRLGRYSTDKQGAYYCADSLHTGLREWAHHTRKYWVDTMHFTNEVSAVVRCYTGHFQEALVDATGRPELMTETYEANHRLLAGALMSNQYGILYNSMRSKGGLCAAILRPPATTKVLQAGHYAILFDGDQFTDYSRLGQFHTL